MKKSFRADDSEAEELINRMMRSLKKEKAHSEIGFRILSAVNDMSEIADYVLSHHERWDLIFY